MDDNVGSGSHWDQTIPPHGTIMALPIYLALPDSDARDALTAALGAGVLLPPVTTAEDLAAHEPGVLVLDPATPAGTMARLAAGLPPNGGGWTLATVVPGPEGGHQVRSLSVGRGHAPSEVADRADDPDRFPQVLVDLPRSLADIARARHDVNNPLTSALAETQLALLDQPGGEIQESLEVIQAQLRRIRDLVAATGHLRPPRS
ncbi:MAG: histidine kinase dimerization/phospho-acceptor domain-containing protein [Longimicrobiales bacterium]